MRAAVCHELGGVGSVTVEEVPSPAVGAGHVKVRVEVAAVNFPDVLLIAGRYQIPVAPPFVPGSEFVGEILEVSPEVSRFEVGDRVAGATLVGAFATEIVTDPASLRPIPDSMSYEVAAAAGVAHRTAYHTLRSVARVGPGDEVVVLGAGGGVGLAAVQVSLMLGAAVTAVASSADKLAAAAAAGATHLIDRRSADLRAELRRILPNGADVVIDPVGGSLSEPALRSLRYGGRFVTLGYAAGEIPRIPLNLVLLKGIAILGFQFIDFATHRSAEYRRNEDELDAALARGDLVPHIGDIRPLDDVVAALRTVAEGNAVGKVLIDLRP